MAELIPAPFADLVTRVMREASVQDTVFDLPRRSWYIPPAGGPDLGVQFHGRHAGNAAGPASGPHTQMAQNLVLAYLAGSRIMELKTVQINDRLEIPRPCIDMTNVGYNVEWSQELRVEESLREYVAGMMLIEILRHASPVACDALRGPAGDVIHDISLGYDLAGIRSDKVQGYLDQMRDATRMIERLRREIPDSLAAARDVPFPTRVSSSMTLSTFHGCPTDEIERICEFLLGERELDVIVKMNPPTIGRGEMEHLLHDVMGYTEIRVPDHAYTASQGFDEALQMVRRLRDFAASRGRRFGCKFSNTLEVENHRDFFPAGNPAMYLSGMPLHVITLTLADRFRAAAGIDLPVTFSAGVDAQNFPSMVACGFAPITTCSDLLKSGGYGRLPAYLTNLAKEMAKVGATTVDEFILRARGNEAAARAAGGDPVRQAAALNSAAIAAEARADERYRAARNRAVPKRIESHLGLFDCLTCDKCIPVCPNDANFTYPIPATDLVYTDLVQSNGEFVAGAEQKKFAIAKKHQIGNYAEFCNECGNCDTFCPEYGGPYIEKPSFYRTLSSWADAAPRDGFVVGREVAGPWIQGRIRERVYTLHGDGDCFVYTDGIVRATLRGAANKPESVHALNGTIPDDHVIDMGTFHALRVMLEGVLSPERLHSVNAAMV